MLLDELHVTCEMMFSVCACHVVHCASGTLLLMLNLSVSHGATTFRGQQGFRPVQVYLISALRARLSELLHNLWQNHSSDSAPLLTKIQRRTSIRAQERFKLEGTSLQG